MDSISIRAISRRLYYDVVNLELIASLNEYMRLRAVNEVRVTQTAPIARKKL